MVYTCSRLGIQHVYPCKIPLLHPYLSWIESTATNRVVGGSNPSGCTKIKQHTTLCVVFIFADSVDSNKIWGPRKITQVILWGEEQPLVKQNFD